MNSVPDLVRNPTRKERFLLRTLITVGFLCMGAFLFVFMQARIVGYPPLYYLLIFSFIFTCVKIVYEWIHYLFITVPETPVAEKTYTVDIFTTFCAGEPYEMITETLTAIQQIRYPHQTYLCDESNDPYLREFCKTLGVHHVTRTVKVDAKAGNINNALKISNGELCVILDPDHVPFPEFLDPIIPHFNNPQVGFVQVIQAYKNADDGFISKGAAQQTYHFYGPMMMTMNRYGTVQAIGANCTFRRTALDSINGHAAGLAEDMNTAMHLHAKGWKSVYVPQILSLGLVPSTLSAYYKQQLKWSRGVFELLVTTYIKKFRQFSLAQKLHYGTIPLYYVSGFVFMVNFLIPIIALFTDRVPVKLGLDNFMMIGIPFGVMIVLIRHYTQKWVAKEEERGFHLVGGILAIGTWWIFVLGIFYTFIRKKVPYVPTPKDGREENNWPLNVVNLVVVFISLVAIVYGLYNDWNPYMWFMAFLALLNCLILLLTIAASRQPAFRTYKGQHGKVNSWVVRMRGMKEWFWISRRRLYAGIRRFPVMIMATVLMLASVLLYKARQAMKTPAAEIVHREMLLSGIYAPPGDVGLSSLSLLQQMPAASSPRFDIVSNYIAWGNKAESYLPATFVDSIYRFGSIPLITWEPWQTNFEHGQSGPDSAVNKHVMARILAGRYNHYIDSFFLQLKALNKPVFLRFAHEPENPLYPWGPAGGNTPEEYRQAWIYLHNRCRELAAGNIIWIWNPFKAKTAMDYFPGENYVDWLGVDILDYPEFNTDHTSSTFAFLYTEFRQLPLFVSGLPVMVAEMGSLAAGKQKEEWLKQGLEDIQSRFPEINAYVYFYSGYDNNNPAGADKMLDWRLPAEKLIALSKTHRNNPTRFGQISAMASRQQLTARATPLFANVKAVNYAGGQDWFANFHPLLKREMYADCREIKSMGMNTVKVYEYGLYDRIMLQSAAKAGLQVIYSLGIPETMDYLNDSTGLKKLEQHVLKSIAHLKKNPVIAGWNLGSNVYQKLSLLHEKPLRYYQQEAFLNWYSRLAKQIRDLDSSRPITADIEVDSSLALNAAYLYQRVPALDGFGLICTEASPGLEAIPQLPIPFYFSSVSPGLYLQQPALFAGRGVTLTDWQDQQRWHLVNFNGLKDLEGNKRNDYMRMAAAWSGKSPAAPLLPAVKIIRPAVTAFPGAALNFGAVIRKGKNWVLAYKEPHDFHLSWYLIRLDRFGNGQSLNKVGEGNGVQVIIPDNPESVRIYLSAERNGQVVSVISKLNLPLY